MSRQQQLKQIFGDGVVINFSNKQQQYDFFCEIKSYGGKWLNGEEIILPKKAKDLPTIFNLHVDSDFVLGQVSAMCMRYGNYKVVDYNDLPQE